MTFTAAKSHVLNRGNPPDEFLSTLVTCAKAWDDSLVAENDNEHDIYALIEPVLGPWTGILHRRAAMMEAMRVHAGFESSWNWNEGVDVTNKHSVANITGEETGIFQVSFDSTALDGSLRAYAASVGVSMPQAFITSMKIDKPLALEYYARLVRINIRWAGPLEKGLILPWLKTDAVAEFQSALVEGAPDAQPV